MKRMIVTVLLVMVVCLGGCAGSLPPHEELNQAVRKSLEATGFNYSAKSRITDLSLPKQDGGAAPNARGLKYLGAGLDIVRGFSVHMDGAIDMKGKKSEALYDLHYDRDNVEVSIKLPLLVDYDTQTIYVGTSIFTTILDAISPQGPETRGKLIKVNIGELLKEGAAQKPELSRLMDGNLLTAKKMDFFNNVFKDVLLKAVTKLNDSCFIDQPLTEQDRKAGVERRIRVTLGHDDSVAVAVDIIDGLAQALLQEGAISKKEYDVLHLFTGKQMLDGFADKFTLTMTSDVGIGQSGRIGYWVIRLSGADKEGNYQVGVENVSSFANYNAPRFTITPEAARIVDFKEVLAAITAASAKDKKASGPEEAPEDDYSAPEGPGPNSGIESAL